MKWRHKNITFYFLHNILPYRLLFTLHGNPGTYYAYTVNKQFMRNDQLLVDQLFWLCFIFPWNGKWWFNRGMSSVFLCCVVLGQVFLQNSKDVASFGLKIKQWGWFSMAIIFKNPLKTFKIFIASRTYIFWLPFLNGCKRIELCSHVILQPNYRGKQYYEKKRGWTQ